MYVSRTSKGKFYYNGEEITEEKYHAIRSMFRNIPTAPEGFAYRLTKELEWELYEVPVEEEPEEEVLTNG